MKNTLVVVAIITLKFSVEFNNFGFVTRANLKRCFLPDDNNGLMYNCQKVWLGTWWLYEKAVRHHKTLKQELKKLKFSTLKVLNLQDHVFLFFFFFESKKEPKFKILIYDLKKLYSWLVVVIWLSVTILVQRIWWL